MLLYKSRCEHDFLNGNLYCNYKGSINKSHIHQEKTESNLNKADNNAKDKSRLQTVVGKIKSPSPKPVDWDRNTRVLMDGGRRDEAFLREEIFISFIFIFVFIYCSCWDLSNRSGESRLSFWAFTCRCHQKRTNKG